MLKIGFVSLDLTPSLGLRCKFDNFDYVDKLYSTTLAPLIVCFVIGVAYVIAVVKARINDDDPGFLKRVESYDVSDKVRKLYMNQENDMRFFLFVFAACDIDGSGAMDRNEFHAAAKKYDPCLEDGEVEAMARSIGFLGFKKVSFEEFMVMMHETQRKKRGKDFLILAEKIQGEKTRMAGQTAINMFLVWTFLILIGTSTIVFFFLKCDTFDLPEADGGGVVRYMFKDYSVDCDKPRYQTTVFYAFLMVFIYPCGKSKTL